MDDLHHFKLLNACFWGWSCLSLVLTLALQTRADQHNVTLPMTSPQIRYTPFLCNGSYPSPCHGAWQSWHRLDTSVISTDGPDPQTGGIIPQMFVSFQASAAYLIMGPSSNATTNLTISASGTTLSLQFNSSVQEVAAVNLIENAITTLAVTFIPGNMYARLDIESVIITVNSTASASFLPTIPLPPSSSPPTFSFPSPTSSASAQASPRTNDTHINMGGAVGLALGIGLILPLVVVAAYYWRQQHRRVSLRKDSEGHPMTGIARQRFN